MRIGTQGNIRAERNDLNALVRGIVIFHFNAIIGKWAQVQNKGNVFLSNFLFKSETPSVSRNRILINSSFNKTHKHFARYQLKNLEVNVLVKLLEQRPPLLLLYFPKHNGSLSSRPCDFQLMVERWRKGRKFTMAEVGSLFIRESKVFQKL